MKKTSEIVKKHRLWEVVNKCCEVWQEDPLFVPDYAKNIYDNYKDNLDIAIACFRELTLQGEKIVKRKGVAQF